MGMWDQAVFDYLLVDHAHGGFREWGPDGVDPSFDTWIEVAHGVGEGIKVNICAGNAIGEVGDHSRRFLFSPGINVFHSCANSLIMKRFMKGSCFQCIGQHDVCDVHRGRGNASGFNAMYANGTVGCDVVVIVVFLSCFAEVLEPRGDIQDVCDGVKFLCGQVAERL